MTEPQIRGAGLLLLFAFMAIMIAGLLSSAGLLGSISDGETPFAPTGVDSVEPSTREIVVQPGWRLEQIANAVDQAGMSGRLFLALTRSPEALARIASDDVRPQSLEGYILPGVYELPAGLGEEQILDLMLDRFEEEVAPFVLSRSTALGFSLHEILTLASIVEKETIRYADSPVIAGVYYNRLSGGIRLEADPTVAYAIDSAELTYREWDSYWERALLVDDLTFPSSYNTYLHEGLPPGPIGSTSTEALRATLFPAQSDYLYFVARGSGSHAFSRTFEEHVSNLDQRLAPESPLQALVEKVMEPVDGHVGVVVRNLETGESAVINAHDLFTSASLYKLPVMGAAFDLRKDGRMAFDQRLEFSADVWSRDSEEARTRLGNSPLIADAAEQMIVISSNAAGEALLDTIGRAQVEAFARAHGMNDTWLTTHRLLTTPADVALFFEKLAGGDLVDEDTSAEMLDILLRQEIDDRLPANLPEGVAVAHKTGSLNYASHDAGILYTSGGPVVIVAMTEYAANGGEATAAISKLGELVYEYFESYLPAASRLDPDDLGACAGGHATSPGNGRLSGRSIVIDPGHGGDAKGATYRFDDGLILQEKDITLDISLRLKDVLIEEGAIVYMTRCTDVNLGLMERAAFANMADPDLFVSIHVNGSEDPERNGTEVYYFSQADQEFGNYMLGSFTVPGLWEALSAGSPLPNRGVLRQEFDVLVYSMVPSILTESLYLTNEGEAIALRDTSGNEESRRQQIVDGHFQGILNYFSEDTGTPSLARSWLPGREDQSAEPH